MLIRKTLCLIFLIGAFAMQNASAGSIDPRTISVQSNNQFGYSLMQVLLTTEHNKNPNKNVFYSPISAALALNLLLNGSPEGSPTYRSIAAPMSNDLIPLKQINASYSILLKSLQDAPAQEPGSQAVPFKIQIANSVWSASQSKFKFAEDYTKKMNEYFQAEIKSVDFKSQTGVDAINGWAKDKTNGKIDKIIDLDTLQNLWFTLINATYFKANWASPFYKAATRADVFTLATGEKKEVQMMHAYGDRYSYYQDNSFQAIELPYASNKASMYVILPSSNNSLLKMEAEGRLLTWDFWIDLKNKMSVQYGNFAMPKYEFSYEIKLNDILKSLGMEQAFNDDADFSLIGAPPTKVDLVKQNTFVKVDEMGTEAAAVTLIGGVETTSLPVNPQFNMVVNRPFFISIVDKQSGAVLFLGSIVNP